MQGESATNVSALVIGGEKKHVIRGEDLGSFQPWLDVRPPALAAQVGGDCATIGGYTNF